MKNTVQAFYGNRLRVRVCGICIHNDSILMINHQGITEGDFWSPPGGGIQFGESAEECLIREFEEEASLTISVERFHFACEFIKAPLHAIELFFKVSSKSNSVQPGVDPEIGSPKLIKEARFMPWVEIATLPTHQLHGIFKYLDHPSQITTLNGYFKV